MIYARKHFLVIISITLLIVMVIPSVNILSDPYRVFSKDYFHTYEHNTENLGYLKVSYLLEHEEDFDSLIFGSSRVRIGFNTTTFARLFSGNWYKMEYPGGVPYQHYSNLETLIRHQYTPRRVILAINDFDLWMENSHVEFQQNYNRRLLPSGLDEIAAFYKFYLFKYPGEIEKQILKGEIKLKKTNRIIGENAGYGLPQGVTESTHTRTILEYEPYQLYAADREYRYQETLDYIRKFIDLCIEHEIEYTIIYLPTIYKTLLARNHDSIDAFKRDLVKLSPFSDFSGIHPESMSVMRWRETSHFTSELGDKMIMKLVDRDSTPGKFGSLVTEENIYQHLSLNRNLIMNNIKGLLQRDNNIYLDKSLLQSMSNSTQLTNRDLTHNQLSEFALDNKEQGIVKLRLECDSEGRLFLNNQNVRQIQKGINTYFYYLEERRANNSIRLELPDNGGCTVTPISFWEV